MSTGTDIIQEALQEIGAHSAASPASAESILVGKDALNSMLEMWLSKGIDFGFSPLDAPGDVLSEPPDTRHGIISNLAMMLVPYFDNGKDIASPELQRTARAQFYTIQRLYRRISVPGKVVSSTLPKGVGNEQGFFGSLFYSVGETLAAGDSTGDSTGADSDSSDPFSADLVLLVNFDGTDGGTDVVDESSQGWALGFLNDAILSNANVFSADYSTALTLNGTGAQVTVGGVNPEALNLSASITGEFTIEARMFSEETTGFNSIVGYDNGGVVHILRDGNGTQLSWLDTRDSAAGQRIAGIGDISPSNTWYEVAVTCNGSANGWDIFSYVDGVQVGSYTAGGDFSDVNPLNCSIGSNNIGGGSDFKGQIQAVRITLADRYGGENYTPESGKWAP